MKFHKLGVSTFENSSTTQFYLILLQSHSPPRHYSSQVLQRILVPHCTSTLERTSSEFRIFSVHPPRPQYRHSPTVIYIRILYPQAFQFPLQTKSHLFKKFL